MFMSNNHKKETIEIAGQKITLFYLKEKKYWVAIKYGDHYEIAEGETKEKAISNIKNKLKNLN